MSDSRNLNPDALCEVSTVFIVDDDEDMRESLEFLLTSAGLEVACFESAEDFLAVYDPSWPGCLLTDVQMPGMGGLALHEELRRRGLAIPVFVMTAYADVSTAVEAMRGGAIDFIEKPFDDRELIERLRRALDQDRGDRAALSPAAANGSQSPQPPAYPPERVGQYRIVRKLGTGGMSEVFLAEDTELHRRVALKFLHLQGASEVDRTRFRQEARSVAALSHPNIVTIFQILEQGDDLCIAMEYVEGRTLRQRLEARDLDAETAVDIAQQICEGLAEAHRLGIVHRDVKPENVIVDARGRARLLDFGLARQERSPRITGDDKMIGTPAYMSPEQAWGEEAGPRSDLFALGVILYEMLVGEYPFRGSNPMQLLKAILSDAPKPFPEDRGDIPEAMRAVVARALEKDPEDRYPDAVSMRAELEALRRKTTPVPGTPAAARPVSGEIERRGGPGPAVWLAVVLLVLVAAATFFRSASRGDRAGETDGDSATAIAVLPFTVRGADELAYLDHGLVELLSLKLDGAGTLRSVDPRALLSYYGRQPEDAIGPATGQQIARRFGARYFTRGSLVGVGSEIHLEVALYDAGKPSDPKSRAVATGPPDDVLRLLDEVAAQLLADVADGSSPRLRKTAVATSASLAAVKAYLRGEARFREGRYEEALAAFQEAVAEDPEFALAHYRLCAVADWVARGEISARAAREAARLSERLNAHDRRLLEALIAWRRGAAREAERIYRAILGTYDDDVEAWFRLGEVLFHYGPRQGRSLDEARQAFENVIDLEPGHVPALWHLTRIAARRDDGPELRRLAARIRELQPAGDRLLEIQAVEAFALGDAALRSRVTEQLRGTRDLTLLITLWDLATFLPERGESRRDALQVTALLSDPARSPEMRVAGHVASAYLHLAAGRVDAGLAALERAAEIDPLAAAEHRALLLLHPLFSPGASELAAARDQLARLDAAAAVRNATPNVFLSVHNGVHDQLRSYLLGRLGLRLGDSGEAARRARELQTDFAEGKIPAEARVLTQDLARGLLARIAFGESDMETATALLRDVQESEVWYGWTTVSPFYSRSAERYLLAESLASAGRFDEALRLFDSFAEHALYDLVYLAPSHLRRAEIHDELGREDLAAHHYRVFQHLWEGCDAELAPWVGRAAQRLAELED